MCVCAQEGNLGCDVCMFVLIADVCVCSCQSTYVCVCVSVCACFCVALSMCLHSATPMPVRVMFVFSRPKIVDAIDEKFVLPL